MKSTKTPGANRANIYLDDKHYRIWMSIPAMRRSKWIREQLKQYEANKNG